MCSRCRSRDVGLMVARLGTLTCALRGAKPGAGSAVKADATRSWSVHIEVAQVLR